MTEGRAFAAMVSSPSSRPTPSSSSSSSSSSSPSSTALAPSPSALQQLWSFLPFSFSSSSPSSLSHSSSSEKSTPPHTRACRSYCCHTPSASSFGLDSTQPQPRSNLRPKNYYSKRQRFMSNQPLGSHYQSSASSASHSDSGSDRDETRSSNSTTTRAQRSGSGAAWTAASQASHLQRRSSPTAHVYTPPTTTTTTTAPSDRCSEGAFSSQDSYKSSNSSRSSSSSHSHSDSSSTDNRVHSRQSSNKLGLVTEDATPAGRVSDRHLAVVGHGLVAAPDLRRLCGPDRHHLPARRLSLVGQARPPQQPRLVQRDEMHGRVHWR
ncbi:unnamed protein product [Mortierella alpina]